MISTILKWRTRGDNGGQDGLESNKEDKEDDARVRRRVHLRREVLLQPSALRLRAQCSNSVRNVSKPFMTF